jgi:hypothetical protein
MSTTNTQKHKNKHNAPRFPLFFLEKEKKKNTAACCPSVWSAGTACGGLVWAWVCGLLGEVWVGELLRVL